MARFEKYFIVWA